MKAPSLRYAVAAQLGMETAFAPVTVTQVGT